MSVALGPLRERLLRLHKVLLDWERAQYEQVHGRQSNAALLNAFLQDSQFAWLRPMSQLIVRIDELLEDQSAIGADELSAVLAQAEALTARTETGSDYERRYRAALQESPEAVFAHRDLVTLLAS